MNQTLDKYTYCPHCGRQVYVLKAIGWKSQLAALLWHPTAGWVLVPHLCLSPAIRYPEPVCPN